MATQRVSFNFMSKLAIDAGVADRLGLAKTTLPIKSVRHLRKKHMIRNDLLPWIEVDPQTYEVRADGRLLMCEPVSRVPLMRRYMLR
jgi:urease subunit alpha